MFANSVKYLTTFIIRQILPIRSFSLVRLRVWMDSMSEGDLANHAILLVKLVAAVQTSV